MKYCEKCGKELSDDAALCMGCGCPTGYVEPQIQVKEKKKFGSAFLEITFPYKMVSIAFISA